MSEALHSGVLRGFSILSPGRKHFTGKEVRRRSCDVASHIRPNRPWMADETCWMGTFAHLRVRVRLPDFLTFAHGVIFASLAPNSRSATSMSQAA